MAVWLDRWQQLSISIINFQTHSIIVDRAKKSIDVCKQNLLHFLLHFFCQNFLPFLSAFGINIFP